MIGITTTRSFIDLNCEISLLQMQGLFCLQQTPRLSNSFLYIVMTQGL